MERKEIIAELVKSGKIKSVDDINKLVKDIFKDTLETMLEAELENELGYSKHDYRNKKTENSRNGKRKKMVRSSAGDIELEVPRDRQGEFEPQVVPKGEKNICEIEDKIISMYANGQSTRNIAEQLEQLYGVQLTAQTISRITDKLLPLIESWRNRPLEACYPIIWMDGLVVKFKSERGVENHCAHIILGISIDGYKEILGIWISKNESSKFWLSVLTELKNRGVHEVLICTVDGLKGFDEAIKAVFPETELQRCLVHQVRYCCRFVNYKDRKEICSDMKKIYTAPTESAGKEALKAFSARWENKYAYAVKSWQDNWENLSQVYHYTDDIRSLMYTTNPIESVNRRFRMTTKIKSQFPSEEAAMKMLYLTTVKMQEKWYTRMKNWGTVIAQLTIRFADRMTRYL